MLGLWMCAPKPAAPGCSDGRTAGTGQSPMLAQEAGLCSCLCPTGASQARGTALPGQGCKCHVQAVPLQTQGWHQTQLPTASGPGLSQLLSRWPVSPKSPGMWPSSVQFAHLGSIVTALTGVAPLCPIALCSTQLPQSQPQLASECCWGLLLAHDLLLW